MTSFIKFIIANLVTAFYTIFIVNLLHSSSIFNLHQISSREFYEEIVFQTVHRIGRGSLEFDNASLFAFIQKAFKITPDVHNKVVLNVKKKKPRSLNFNIDVIEAKDLTPMDANGLSDPFVSLYFESNESLKRTSAIKLKTLNPQFDEQFIL